MLDCQSLHVLSQPNEEVGPQRKHCLLPFIPRCIASPNVNSHKAAYRRALAPQPSCMRCTWTWRAQRPVGRDSWARCWGDARTNHRPSRERHAQKYAGLLEITSLDTEAMENAVDHRELVRISETFDELGKVEPALTEIIDL